MEGETPVQVGTGQFIGQRPETRPVNLRKILEKKGMLNTEGQPTTFGLWVNALTEATNDFDISKRVAVFGEQVAQVRSGVEELYNLASDDNGFYPRADLGKKWDIHYNSPPSLDNTRLQELGISRDELKILNRSMRNVIYNLRSSYRDEDMGLEEMLGQKAVKSYIVDMLAASLVIERTMSDYAQKWDFTQLGGWQGDPSLGFIMYFNDLSSEWSEHDLLSRHKELTRPLSPEILAGSAELHAFGWASDVWLQSMLYPILLSNKKFQETQVKFIYEYQSGRETVEDITRLFVLKFKPHLYHLTTYDDKIDCIKLIGSLQGDLAKRNINYLRQHQDALDYLRTQVQKPETIVINGK